MEFFSTRNKVISINPNGLRSTSIELRERIWNVFYKEEYDYYDTVDYTSYTTGIEDNEIRFFSRGGGRHAHLSQHAFQRFAVMRVHLAAIGHNVVALRGIWHQANLLNILPLLFQLFF